MNRKINEKLPNDVIIETHVTSYMDKTGKVIFWMLLALLVADIITCTLVRMGYFTYFLEKHNNVTLTHITFIGETIVKIVITWTLFCIYLILYSKSNYKNKKILICTFLIVLTTLICFGHWKYSYLSILYSIPVVFTCPLGKKTHKIVFAISIVLSIVYSVFQYFTFKTGYNFLIGTVSITTLVTFYLISSNVYNSMMEALLDVEKFYTLSTKLTDEISHDCATGAFSKSELLRDLSEIKSLKSIAFIDLDNFKHINDTRGHSIGDRILKNIVRCFNSREAKIYRYGGDEFVILSELSVDNLSTKIEMVKIAYNNSSKALFACDATFSAGVMAIDHNDDIDTIIKKCDQVMYISKHEGKNKISVKK